MKYRTASEVQDQTGSSSSGDRDRSDPSRRDRSGQAVAQDGEERFGMEMYKDGLDVEVQRLVYHHGAEQVQRWADEGMTVDTMGKPHDMETFRERQQERPSEVPKDIERRNAKSIQRSRGAHHEPSKAGSGKVPDSVRDVVSSAGQQLDVDIQNAMEERMGDSLGDVRIHTGPSAAKACEDINARAFTVGNHIAFNRGEYDPSSVEGQHVLAHELAHVRQQTGGAVSMLPQKGTLEIDPDEQLEREAEETAERVMRGGKLGIYRMRKADVHVQRMRSGEQLREQLSSKQESKLRSIIEETEDYDSAGEFIAQLSGQLTGLNHKLHKKEKLRGSSEITAEDLLLFEHRENSRPHCLLDTDKWAENIDLRGTGMHDFKHIVARHANPDSEGNWPVSPGGEQRSISEAFPEDWGPQEIQEVIQRTITDGQVGNDSGELVYDGPELDGYDFDEVVVRRNPSTGIIQTAFPRRQ